MTGGHFIPPSPDEARAMLGALHLTGAQAGALVGIGGRQVRRYTGGEQHMPFGVLYTLIHRTSGRAITPGGWREEISDLLG